MPIKFLGHDGRAEVAVIMRCQSCFAEGPMYYRMEVPGTSRGDYDGASDIPRTLTHAFMVLDRLGNMLELAKVVESSQMVQSVRGVWKDYGFKLNGGDWDNRFRYRLDEESFDLSRHVLRPRDNGRSPDEVERDAHALFLGRMLWAFIQQNEELAHIFQRQQPPLSTILRPHVINHKPHLVYFLTENHGNNPRGQVIFQMLRRATRQVAAFLKLVDSQPKFNRPFTPDICIHCRTKSTSTQRLPASTQVQTMGP